MHPTHLLQTTPTPTPHIAIPPDQTAFPGTPITPPPSSGDSLFWTIVALAILTKALLGNTDSPLN
jgi:hypothetical protein